MRLFIVVLCFLFVSCSNSEREDFNDNNLSQVSYEWTVPLIDLLGNFNPFPLAENPILKKIHEVEGISDQQTVILVSIEDQVNIYPLHFIHSYEVINDNIHNTPFIITYCPITQSTTTVVGKHKNEKLTFRASGILYKENLIMYDSNTDTFWSQMLLTCIKGKFEGNQIENLAMIETTWKTAKTYFPNANVFTSSSILSSKNLPEISNDEKVFGIVNNVNVKNSNVSIYRYSDFENEIVQYSNSSANNDIVIGSNNLKFITAFQNTGNLNFNPIQNEFPLVLIDETGTKYNVFGQAVEGPNLGNNLKPSTGYIAAWWAWQDFYNSFNFVE